MTTCSVPEAFTIVGWTVIITVFVSCILLLIGFAIGSTQGQEKGK
jgi:hypothetical protein